jgi:hypothetical protein
MSKVGLAIPKDWDDITPEWMTEALSRDFPGADVSRVTIVLRDDGTNRRARLGLEYTSGSGPQSVFAKAADPAHAELIAFTSGAFNEPRLFLSGLPIPVDHPAVHLALMDETTADFLLVMEDVSARGADARDSLRPLSIDQAANGVRALARLHSAYWGHRLDDCAALAWVRPFVAWNVMAGGIDIGIERCGDTIPSEVRKLTGEAIESGYWARLIGTLTDGPQTLLHGDAHIGNTYVLPNDDVGFLDWQVLRRGNFSLDLGYFLQGAISKEDRRANEVDLVGQYYEALDLPAEERPTNEEVWLRYRASAAHGLALWLATASGSTWQLPEVSLALARRYSAAFTDLDTASAIDELTHLA